MFNETGGRDRIRTYEQLRKHLQCSCFNHLHTRPNALDFKVTKETSFIQLRKVHSLS